MASGNLANVPTEPPTINDGMSTAFTTPGAPVVTTDSRAMSSSTKSFFSLIFSIIALLLSPLIGKQTTNVVAVIIVVIAFSVTYIQSQNPTDTLERCQPGYDIVIAVPPEIRKLCDLDACLCNSPWKGENCDIPVEEMTTMNGGGMPTEPPAPVAPPCNAGELGCACVADKCKDMHGDCVRGVCACIRADSENCDFAKCVEGDDGCLCTPEGTCQGAKDAVACLELDLSGNTACLSLGEPSMTDTGNLCLRQRTCRDCTSAPGCTWCGDVDDANDGICADKTCTEFGIPALSLSCGTPPCCPVESTTPKPPTFSCSPPQYRKDNACVPCPDGKYPSVTQLTCIACPSGYYRAGAMTKCERCPKGKYATLAKDGCNLCSSGREQSSLGTTCVDCPAGSVRVGTSSSGCSSCSSSRVPNKRQDKCLATDTGIAYYSAKKSNVNADEDFFSLGRLVSNSFCIPGGFAIRGGDLDESGQTLVPLAAAVGVTGTNTTWYGMTRMSAHKVAPNLYLNAMCFDSHLVRTTDTFAFAYRVQSFFRAHEFTTGFNWRTDSKSAYAPAKYTLYKVDSWHKNITFSWSYGPCFLAGFAAVTGDFEEGGERATTLAVEENGSKKQLTVDLGMLEGERTETFYAATICFKSQFADLLTVFRRFKTGCGSDARLPGVSPSTHTCTAHGFHITSDLYEDNDYNTKQPLLQVHTYKTSTSWYATVDVRRGTAKCTAWVNVACFKTDRLEWEDVSYKINDAPSNWLPKGV
mmetsp:Transcript_10659/g.17782  ORF Transcript_10659/g.17782 Transcript_10659/m.17782 type:complete len:753 (-) Transcript_10659:61-2319(-)